MSTSNPGQQEISLPLSTSTINWEGLPYLFAVYLIWSSTYLAIRFGVREGSGFPPFTLGYWRLLLAGAVLLSWAALSKTRLRPTRGELLTVAGSGLLLWSGGNGLVLWAEQRADSSYAALIIGMTPIWVALIESLIDRQIPSRLLVTSLLLGAAGVGLLSTPRLVHAASADVLSLIALLGASINWALGTVLQRRRPVQLSPRVSSAYQHLFGGVGFLLVALLIGEGLPHPTTEAWLAWGYLVIAGSVIAFTSFVQALRLLPVNIVMTYAYVNPVLAMFLGWIILHEPLNAWTFSGSALILLGVAGVFHNRARQRKT